jgi:hypothetical protein
MTPRKVPQKGKPPARLTAGAGSEKLKVGSLKKLLTLNLQLSSSGALLLPGKGEKVR